MPLIPWPEGKKFAFTIFDDTDRATLENVKPVYDFLTEIGLLTTKSVWPVRGPRQPLIGGSTCEDPGYLKWLLSLQETGFEIGLHNVTYHSSRREETIRGFEIFRKFFGHDPHALANHADCEESIYWGNDRLSGLYARLYNLLKKGKNKNRFRGHIKSDEFFWGDLCREKVKYVRNFVFPDINTLKACPMMPYHDPSRPFVAHWFASSEGLNMRRFNECLSEENQDRLEEEGGACIMYTHFAFEFLENGHLNARFKNLMERLAGKNGWFVPVSTLLDFLLQTKGSHTLSRRERMRLERRWLWHKFHVGSG